MDGFDDLLAPSRRVLEDNPFADPFAKRSNSPDPWASPFANSQPTDEYGPTTESYVATPDPNKAGSISSDAFHDTSAVSPDPLDSAARTAEEEDEEHPGPRGRSTSSTRTPGFRESVVTPAFSEIATIRPTEPEEEHEPPVLAAVTAEQYPTSPPPRKANSPSPTSPPPVSREGREATQSPQSNSRVVSPAPSTSKISEFVSPLERPRTGIDHSIVGLSVGGEALGGWQAEQVGWGAQDDDSDDDKPISQTVRIPDQVDNKLVRTHQHPY